MVDLETYATSADAVVMTIGAIVFSSNGQEVASFYRRITEDSCISIGLRKDPETVKFWNGQPIESRFEIETPLDRVCIIDAIAEFSQFWKDNNCKYFWCLGANFDEPIMALIYQRLNLEKPWMFYNVRCLRTLYSLARVTTKELTKVGDVDHHALADCRKQIRGFILSYKRLKINN